MESTPRELLSNFYATNHLDKDGGQASSYVKIEFSPNFYFYFPNFNARRKAVIKHDIHHLLTGYDTTIWGESEISAWEIGSGCKSYWAVFFIDTSGTMLGIPLNFGRVLTAFSRGRKTKNLFHDVISTEQALDMKLGELLVLLDLDKNPKNTKPEFTDLLLFLAFAFYGAIYSVLLLPLIPLILFYSLCVKLWATSRR